jgi:hypothetical protein
MDVVVAREIHDIGSSGSGCVTHDRCQVLVAGRIAGIGKITSEDEQVGFEASFNQRGQSGAEVVARIHPRQQRSLCGEVDVGYLDEEVFSQPRRFRMQSLSSC